MTATIRQQFTTISDKTRRALRSLGGKVSKANEVTFPEGTVAAFRKGRTSDGFHAVEQITYTIPGGSILVYHPEFGLYVHTYTGVYGG